MLTVMVVGVVPLRGLTVSQLLPSAVLETPVQLKVPVPALRIWKVCAGTLVALVCKREA